MPKTYSVTLNDAQDKAFQYAAIDPQDWVDNLVLHRVEIAIDEIANAEIQRKLAAGEPITGSKEDIVLAADIKTAAERHAEFMAQQQAELDALNTQASE